MSFVGAQSQGVVVKAIRYPPCLCGKPFGDHKTETCSGYCPKGEIENLGTRAYRPGLHLPVVNRVVCGMIWMVERRLQRWREHLGRV